MTVSHKNRVQMSVSGTPGTGTITLGSAASGYQSFSAAHGANATVDCLFEDGTAWEIARGCTYTHSGTTMSRGTLEASSTGSAISLTSAAVVSQIATATRTQQWTDISGVFGSEEISVTGAVTATIGAMHHCTGTSADYTVTLPAASGNAGKMLGFRMGPVAALSKLVTLDGNSTETIDGATTRIMWADETAILLCDGSNWFKVAGKSIPMFCLMHRSAANQTGVATTTVTKVTLDTITTDSAGMGDTGNARIGIKRPGLYIISGAVGWDNLSGSSTRILSQIQINGSAFVNAEGNAIASGSYATPFAVKPKAGMAVGDLITLHGYHAVGSNQSIYGTGAVTHVSVLEAPIW